MTTVGQLVAERPERGRLFEKLGIDYCCAGRVSLDEACVKRGLDPVRVREQLRVCDEEPAGAPGRDWTTEPLAALADHIEARHHRFMRVELPRAAALVAKVARAHGERRPELLELQRVFEGFARELLAHMDAEESGLFPWVRSLEGDPRATGPTSHQHSVRALMAEHDHAGRALDRMRTLTNGFTPPADACGTFRVMLTTLREIEADMHEHVHKENNILFPRALGADALRGSHR